MMSPGPVPRRVNGGCIMILRFNSIGGLEGSGTGASSGELESYTFGGIAMGDSISPSSIDSE